MRLNEIFPKLNPAHYAGLHPIVGFKFEPTAEFTAARIKAGSVRSQTVRRQFSPFIQGKSLRAQGCCLIYGTKYRCHYAGEDRNGAGFIYIYDLETKNLVGVYITLAERYAVEPKYLPTPAQL